MNVAHLFDSGQANLFSPDEGGPGIMGQTCHELTGVWKYPIHWYHWLFNNDYNMTIYIWLLIHYMAIEYPSSSHSMIFNGHIMPCMYPNVSIHWHISLAYWGLNHAKSTILQKPCVRQKEHLRLRFQVMSWRARRAGQSWWLLLGGHGPGGCLENRMNEASTGKPVQVVKSMAYCTCKIM